MGLEVGRGRELFGSEGTPRRAPQQRGNVHRLEGQRIRDGEDSTAQIGSHRASRRPVLALVRSLQTAPGARWPFPRAKTASSHSPPRCDGLSTRSRPLGVALKLAHSVGARGRRRSGRARRGGWHRTPRLVSPSHPTRLLPLDPGKLISAAALQAHPRDLRPQGEHPNRPRTSTTRSLPYLTRPSSTLIPTPYSHLIQPLSLIPPRPRIPTALVTPLEHLSNSTARVTSSCRVSRTFFLEVILDGGLVAGTTELAASELSRAMDCGPSKGREGVDVIDRARERRPHGGRSSESAAEVPFLPTFDGSV